MSLFGFCRAVNVCEFVCGSVLSECVCVCVSALCVCVCVCVCVCLCLRKRERGGEERARERRGRERRGREKSLISYSAHMFIHKGVLGINTVSLMCRFGS